MGTARVTVSHELHDRITTADAQAKDERRSSEPLPKYSYPVEVATAAGLGYLAAHGMSLEIMPESCAPVRALEAQREAGKAIYGGGLLLGSQSAAEKAAAEKAAAEKAAATKWQLSDAEREIINGLK